MVKYLGGRGKKAPYTSIVIRVPEPITDKVNSLIESYKSSFDSQETCNEFTNINDTIDFDSITISKQELLELASKIIKTKQSGKKSVIKLVTTLLNNNITDEEISKL